MNTPEEILQAAIVSAAKVVATNEGSSDAFNTLGYLVMALEAVEKGAEERGRLRTA